MSTKPAIYLLKTAENRSTANSLKTGNVSLSTYSCNSLCSWESVHSALVPLALSFSSLKSCLNGLRVRNLSQVFLYRVIIHEIISFILFHYSIIYSIKHMGTAICTSRVELKFQALEQVDHTFVVAHGKIPGCLVGVLARFHIRAQNSRPICCSEH